MNWTCEQTEARLSDYLDGVLQPAEQTAFNAHVAACERCAPLIASVSHLVSGMHSMEQLEAPPRLVYAILDKTLGPRETVTGWKLVLSWVRGMASVRFAYGALSLAATAIVLITASGFNWRHPKMADLQPTNIYRNADRQAHLVYARSAKFVSDLRVVNEIQSRLRQDNDIPPAPESEPSQKQPGRSDSAPPTSPRQQNRAYDPERHVNLFAMANLFAINSPFVHSQLQGPPSGRKTP
ncbi:MAG TPA: anti-sigma factor [Candidatus Acidoferrum sp.]